MDYQARIELAREKYAHAKLQFIRVELDLAITYCQIAVGTRYPAWSRRNITNADRAYSAAVYFLIGEPEAEKSLEIQEKLEQFRSVRMSCDSGTQVQ